MILKKRLNDCEKNIRKTLDTIKEVMGTLKSIDNGLPKMMGVNGRETLDQSKIANGFKIRL